MPEIRERGDLTFSRRLAATALLIVAGPVFADSAVVEDRILAMADSQWRRDLASDPDLRSKLDLPILDIAAPNEATLQQLSRDARGRILELQSISGDGLGEDARILHDILLERATLEAEAGAFYWLDFALLPSKIFRQLEAIHRHVETAPLKDDADRAAYLALIRSYARLFSAHHDKLLGQESHGLRMPRDAIGSVAGMLRTLRDSAPQRFKVTQERLGGTSPTEEDLFWASVDHIVEAEVRPVLDGLIGYIDGPYRTLAPGDAGLSGHSGADRYYRHLIRYWTTLDADPDAVHALGLRRTEEIEGAILNEAAKIGLQGDLKSVIRALRGDRSFVAASPEQAEQHFKQYIKEMELKVDDHFEKKPRAPYGVRPLPAEFQGALAFGFYQPPTGRDGTGYYVYNGSSIGERSLLNAQAIIYHELIPGHHFQIATQLEQPGLHPLRQHYLSSGYAEGWAEYAASLAEEMGLYNTPHRMIGRKSMEMFFAVRLVVDTGLAHKGWTLDQARAFMADRLLLSSTEIESEVIRYATRPGQALAYALGFEHIRALRRRAEASLCEQFDRKKFHGRILSGGNVPLPTLELIIDSWINSNLKLKDRQIKQPCERFRRSTPFSRDRLH